jgi:hypothetical protein
MAPPITLGAMPATKKEKHYANSRAHRGSSIVVSHSGSKKSKKDTDTESVSSDASTVVPPPPPKSKPKPQCPLRPYMEVMFEPEEDGEKKPVCPLRRVKLSHVLPLCLFVMINMCLVVGTLLITGICRISVTLMDWGRKQPKEVDNPIFNKVIYSHDFSGFMFLAMALFAFFVTMCYGPEWMSTTFQVCTTTGFFVGLSMTLMAKKEATTITTSASATPTTPGPTDS